MPNQQEQGNRSPADRMSNKELRAQLQRLGIDAHESLPKQHLQQLLKMATELHQLKSSSGQPSDAAGGGGVVVSDADAFICPLCTDEHSPIETVKTPRILERGHSFCLSCLCKSRGQLKRDARSRIPLPPVTYGIMCPTCRPRPPTSPCASFPITSPPYQ